MLLSKTDIREKLLRERARHEKEQSILDQVRTIFEEHRSRENDILDRLKKSGDSLHNQFNIDVIDAEAIFHISQIKKICVDYRLRFLDTKYFKGKIPVEALTQIKQLEDLHDTQLDGFKIIAPSKMFVLEKADDPLLFAPMGNGYYHLIHKWGNDLHPLRKWLMWPYKSFENLIVAIVLASVVATLLIPNGMFAKEQSLSQDIMVFFFMFKSIAAVVLFYGFALGKNFNTVIWNSKFDKS